MSASTWISENTLEIWLENLHVKGVRMKFSEEELKQFPDLDDVEKEIFSEEQI